jgi:hypothetical protein
MQKRPHSPYANSLVKLFSSLIQVFMQKRPHSPYANMKHGTDNVLHGPNADVDCCEVLIVRTKISYSSVFKLLSLFIFYVTFDHSSYLKY